jgi:hypothetical protein
LLGHPIRSFAYPFGTPTSFDATTVEVIREAGYERACVNTGGLVSRRSDRFRLPRYPVYDWPAEEFRQRVEAWFAGR